MRRADSENLAGRLTCLSFAGSGLSRPERDFLRSRCLTSNSAVERPNVPRDVGPEGFYYEKPTFGLGFQACSRVSASLLIPTQRPALGIVKSELRPCERS